MISGQAVFPSSSKDYLIFISNALMGNQGLPQPLTSCNKMGRNHNNIFSVTQKIPSKQ